jgi:hypothetical protein
MFSILFLFFDLENFSSLIADFTLRFTGLSHPDKRPARPDHFGVLFELVLVDLTPVQTPRLQEDDQANLLLKDDVFNLDLA